jgi:phage terminase large subunit-like protein
LRKLTPKTTLGFECIDFAERTLELELMPWQKWFLLHALELHPTEVDEYGDPVFRFRKVILLVGRQNGKSTVMQALTLWRMFADRCSLVIGTAQDLEVAESLWAESLELAQETEELRVEIERGKVERQPGRKMFRLRTGETYKVKAASRRGGRGLSGELVLLDELR